jgi:inner membrane protein
MVSAFTHAAAAAMIGTLIPRKRLPRRAWLVGAVAAVLPDLDYFLHRSGFWGEHPYVHRGFTHSLTFAAALGGALTALAAWRRWPGGRWWWFGYLALSTASHGVLDAFTNGGEGIAFLWPFTNARWHFPWTPIEVAPLSITGFFTADGAEVFASELLWVWLPAAALVLAGAVARRHRKTRLSVVDSSPTNDTVGEINRPQDRP